MTNRDEVGGGGGGGGEAFRGSTRKSGASKSGQKFQNSVAFHHNKNSKLTKKIAATPITGLCAHCLEVVEWRKRYRKYKPLTVAKKWYVYLHTSCAKEGGGKSVGCEEKRIKEAYHVICSVCSKERKCCAKCLTVRSDEQPLAQTTSPAEMDPNKIKELTSGLRERERRSVLRKLEKGDDTVLATLEAGGDSSGEGDSSEEDSSEEEE